MPRRVTPIKSCPLWGVALRRCPLNLARQNDSLLKMQTNDRGQIAHPSFAEAFRFWVKLGLISFGGPTGQIAIMQTELVDKKKVDQSVTLSSRP